MDTADARPTPRSEPGTARPMPAEVAPAAGDPKKQFGRYILVRELGRGGFGAVYKAWQSDLGRYVAIKFLFSETEADIQRFLREAQTAAALNHPGIVPIYDIGERDGRHFIAMELIEGETLARLRLTPREAAEVVRDAAVALEYAHSRGIVHRDLKPQNIMKSGSRVMVMDFGLARQVAGGTTLTMSGMMVGTPAYMAPEQARGDVHAITPQTDVYGLGATLYELLTGRPPFLGNTPLEVAMQVLHNDPPAPRAVRPTIERDLESIALKAIEKEPAKRFGSARELADDLDRFLRGEPISAHPPSFTYRLRKRLRRHPAMVAAGAVLLAVVAYFAGPSWIVVDGTRRLAWPAGRHEFDLPRDGFEVQRVRVTTLPWRSTPWVEPPVADHGFVDLRTTPPGASVTFLVNNQVAARATANAGPVRVPRGTVEVRCALDDHAIDVSPLFVPPGATVVVERALAHDQGLLTVTCEPVGVSMKIGDDRHALPVTRLEVDTGSYELRFSKANHFKRRVTVRVDKGLPRQPLRPLRMEESGLLERREPGVTTIHASLVPMEIWVSGLDAPARLSAETPDLDGDGAPDLVASAGARLVAVSGSNRSTLWSFTAGDVLPSSPALADLDADGIDDAVVCSVGGLVMVVSGRDGTLLWEKRLKGSLMHCRPALADLDADGVPDVITWPGSQVVALSGRDGRELWTAVAGVPLRSVCVPGDLNGDSAVDIVLLPPRGRIAALSGRDGTILWRGPTAAIQGVAPETHDVDGDGARDLLVGTNDAGLLLISGRRGDVLWSLGKEQDASGPVFADLDGDGRPECVVQTGDAYLRCVAPDGSERWRAEVDGWTPGVMALDDTNSDGVRDLLIVMEIGRVELRSGRDGAHLWTYEATSEVSAVTMADVDLDGRLDVIVGFVDARVVALRTSDAGFRWRRLTDALETDPPRLADLDADGVPDVVSTSDWAVEAFSGRDGSLLWRFQATAEAFAPPALGDLDGDGTPDVVAVTRSPRGERRLPHAVAVSGRTGSLLWSVETGDVDAEPLLVDLDRDGTMDVVVTERSRGGSVRALSGRDGRRMWECPATAGVDQRASAGDLDGDGDPDVVFTTDEHTVRAVTGRTGAKLWDASVRGAVLARGLADLNGDGVPDLLAATAAAPTASILALSGRNGAVLWERRVGIFVESLSNPSDLDGDLVADVVVSGYRGVTVGVSGKNGAMLWGCWVPSTAGEPPVLTDLDGDGRPECLLTKWHLHELRTRYRSYLLGPDGRLLRVFDDASGLEPAQGGLVMRVHQQMLVVRDAAPAKMPAGLLKSVQAWPQLARERGTDRVTLFHRALATMRMGNPAASIDLFHRSAALGLRSPELEAATLEALLRTDRLTSADLSRAGRESIALLLARGRFAKPLRDRLAALSSGDDAGLLLLAGRSADALRILADATDPATCALRILAYRDAGRDSDAEAEVTRAIRRYPGRREFQRMAVELADRDAAYKD